MQKGGCKNTYHVILAGAMAANGIVASPKRQEVFSLVFLHHQIVNLLPVPACRPDQTPLGVENHGTGFPRFGMVASRRQHREATIIAALVVGQPVESRSNCIR